MKSLNRDGVRLCYEDSTLAGVNRAPIVVVHGWCCDHRYFAPQYGHFSARHHVVAVDQRGFGASDKPQQKYTIEGFADDLAWLCRELGLTKPALVGHSMGGAVALATAARHPELPRAIALCDPAIFFPSFFGSVIQPFLQGLASPGYKDVARGFADQRLFIDADDKAMRARIVDEMSTAAQQPMHTAFESIVSFDSESAAKACKVPALLIDAEPPVCERARFKAACPQLQFASTAGAGHFHQLLVPDQVNAMLERFLA